MAFAPRSMTGGQPLYGPRVNYTSSDAQRQQLLAQQLLREGASTRPAEGGIGEVLARIGTAGLGGYFSGQAQEKEDSYRAEKAKVLAQALAAGQGTPAAPPPTLAGGEAAATRGTGIASQATPGDPQRMAAILMGNPQTADMGAQLALGQMQYKQQRGDTLADRQDERAYQGGVRKEERGYRLEDLYLTQNFQKEMQAMNQAFAAGQQDKALQHATNIAQMQQQFTSGENALNRTAQADLAQKQIDAQQPTRDLTNMLTGQKIIENKEKIADAAKSKDEAIVSTDRMIRSIDEIANHPGLSGTVGFGYGMRYIPGTEEASFDVRLETLKSQAFLPMVAQLKGMGQLSDAEGKKLTAAIGALDPKMSEKEFKASLAEIKGDLEAARKRMGAPAESTVTAPGRPGGNANLPPLPSGFVPVQ